MIAIDMDGTLLGLDGRVSAENLAALRAAESAGIEVVIATGRRHCYAMRCLRGHDLVPEMMLVSSNGTVTRALGPGAELVDRTLLPRETALWLCELLGEFRNAMVLTFDRVQPDGEDAQGALVIEELAGLHASIGRWMEANEPYIEQVRPIEDALASESPIQMMLCGTIERMRRAEQRLLQEPGVIAVDPTEETSAARATGAQPELATARVTLSRTEYPERDLSLLDILPAGCSKGAALLRLMADRGLGRDALMAIGDNWNDLSMLEIAGRPVLMDNAPEELKKLAGSRGWQIGGHHERHGVAEAILGVLAAQGDVVAAVEESSVVAS